MPQAYATLPADRRAALKGLRERAVQLLLLLCGAASVMITLGIVVVLFGEALPFFREVPLWSFLSDTEWTPLFID